MWLFITEFIYNNLYYAFTEKSFFYLVYKLDSRIDFLNSCKYDIANTDSCSWADFLQDYYAQAKKLLVKTQVYQKEYYNKKYAIKIFKKED